MVLLLASASDIRLSLLRAAGVAVEAQPARIDETTILTALQAEGARPRDIADTLAEMKARKVSDRVLDRLPEAFILGCDQVLDFEGQVWQKPQTPDDARHHLQTLRAKRHKLLSAAVLYHRGEPVWRYVGEVRLTMRQVSDHYIDSYVSRNWDGIRHCVGAYKLEEEGARLFSQIDGDYFTVLGLPLLPLLGYLSDRGVLPS